MEAFDAKQSYEAYYIDFDFVNVIGTDDEISTAAVTVADPDGADVTTTLTNEVNQQIVSPKVLIWVRAGTTGKTYTFTCKIVTVDGEKYEEEATLAVLDT